MTSHSFFHLPIDSPYSANCSFTRMDKHFPLLERAKVIIWDEVSASLKSYVEAVDRMMRNVFDMNYKIFAGKKIVFCGDFRQTLPIIPGAYDTQILTNTIKYASFWPYIRKFHLLQNLRAGSENQRFSDAFQNCLH